MYITLKNLVPNRQKTHLNPITKSNQTIMHKQIITAYLEKYILFFFYKMHNVLMLKELLYRMVQKPSATKCSMLKH